MQDRARRWVRAVGLASAMALVVVVAAACGSSTSASSPSATPAPAASGATASPTPDEAQITSNWVAFFAGSTSAAKKIVLLQNGPQFATVIKAQSSSPLAQSTEAKVASVTVLSPTTATVKYSILLAGQVALADQTGQAVKQGGIWKVSAKSFSALLALEGQTGSPSPAATP